MFALTCALLAAGLAGFSRGFAAFGTAMVFIPLVTMAYDTKTAVVTLFLVDIIPSVPLIWKAAPQCDRRTIFWMGVGAIALTPVGVALLLVSDQAHSQFVVGVFLLASVSYMLVRPGFRVRATAINSIGAGALSGLAGGLSGIFGPPAAIYLLGRSTSALTSRADIIVYLTGESLVLGTTYLVYGMYTPWHLELSLLLMPVYALCMWCGARKFSHTTETSYRRILLALLWVISALLTMRGIFAAA